MMMVREQMEELYYVRTRINNYLEKINFKDEDLVQLSLKINNILDIYEDSLLSEEDRKAKELRLTLVDINKRLSELLDGDIK